MKHLVKFVSVVICLLVLGGFNANAQQMPAQKMAGKYLISIYHVAPGKHLQFLKWMAQREAVAKEAGAPATQWYNHHDGDSWDYVGISPVLDGAKQDEMDQKVDKLAKEKGLTSGMAAQLEFRQFINSHTDTYSSGPYTAEELVKKAEQK